MVFCNLDDITKYTQDKLRHNPYFNRWFSAIPHWVKRQMAKERHNPYFNRWFSAIGTIYS